MLTGQHLQERTFRDDPNRCSVLVQLFCLGLFTPLSSLTIQRGALISDHEIVEFFPDRIRICAASGSNFSLSFTTRHRLQLSRENK